MTCNKLQPILKEIAILKSKFHFLIIPVNNVWYVMSKLAELEMQLIPSLPLGPK